MAAVDREAKRVGHRHRRRPGPCCGGADRRGRSRIARRHASISRSMMLTASAKPGPRVTPIGVVLVSTALICSAIAGIAIDRALQMDVLVGLHAAGAAGHIGADIGDAADAQREKPALRIERQRSIGLMVARLMVGDEALAAGGDPFDRAADALGRPQDQRMLGIDEVLRAEAAADIGCDEPHGRGRHAQRAGALRRGCHGCSGWRHAACSGPVPHRRCRPRRAAPSGW